MGILIKKFIAPLFFPLSISLELLLIGIYLLLFSKRQTSGKVFVVFGFLLLATAGHQIPSDKLLGPLESKYQPVTDVQQQLPEEIRHIRWIVVLGGGHSVNPDLPPTKRTSATSMERLVEGIRLYRMISGSKLLLSGGSVYDSTSDALFMSDVAVSLGVDKHDIVLETESKDTDDEAQMILPMLHNEKFLLVTSASHMPRSMNLFLKLCMHPIAAPTDFMVENEKGTNPNLIYPNVRGLAKSERAVYEYIGELWSFIRGKV